MFGRVLRSTHLIGNVHRNCSGTSLMSGHLSFLHYLPQMRLATDVNPEGSVLPGEEGKKIKKMHSRKIRLFKDKPSDDLVSNLSQYNPLAPRVGKSTAMAFDELPEEIVLAESRFDIRKELTRGTATHKLKTTYIEPPEEFKFPIAGLAEELRPVLLSEGPVPFVRMSDTNNLLDLSGKFHVKITQPLDVNWDSIPPFVTASRDATLVKLGIDIGAEYMASTSSLSGLLSQQHFALTSFAPIQEKNLSAWFKSMPKNHTRSAAKASSSLVRKRMYGDKVAWGVDNYPSGEPKQNQILIDLGKSLERHLTFTEADFNKYFVLNKDEEGTPIPDAEVGKELPHEEAHSFVRVGKMFLRSQLDCEDQTVPNNKKVFDLKTRATLPIRMDIGNHDSYIDYKILQKKGLYNSFEREFYDMCRTAFLKYSFQCRIGDMGGVLVAYHNTQELFGMEYIKLSRMDEALYGDSEKANFVYKQSIFLTEKLLDHLIPENSTSHERDCFRLTVKAYNGKVNAFVETIPDIDCNDAEVLDKVLSDFHTGVMYVDRLTREQATGALARRGLNTTGTLPELLSRLEGHICPSDFQFKPRTLAELDAVVAAGRLKAYVMNVVPVSPLGNPMKWTNIEQADRVSVSYNIKQLDSSVNLASLYNFVLNDYVLFDSRSEKLDKEDEAAGILVPGENRTITVGTQKVEVTSTQHHRMLRRKASMELVMEEAKMFQEAIESPEAEVDHVLNMLRQKQRQEKQKKHQELLALTAKQQELALKAEEPEKEAEEALIAKQEELTLPEKEKENEDKAKLQVTQ